MICLPRDMMPYQIKRVEAEGYGQARDFIYQYESEFKTKKWWDDRLPNMIYDGLTSEKWTAYALYNHQGKMVAYIDYKIRTDGDIELGTQLTDASCRKQGIATGLINFMRLKFINSCFFTGTHEKNEGMKRVFEKLGFQETLFYDPVTGESSNRIQERIDPAFPDDEDKMTNSIYFHIMGIMEETRLGAVEAEPSQVCPEVC